MFIVLIVMLTLTPLIMIGFGLLWRNNIPEEINSVYGYRTSMSMKNKDTWNFAHKYHAKIWFWTGVIILPISIIIMILFKDNFERVSLWILGVQIVILCISILPTEIALRKTFDKDGKRIK